MDLRDVNLGEPWGTWYRLGLHSLLQPPNRSSVPLTKDRARLPSPWSEILANVCPPTPIVWTYWHLAKDLGPQPDLQRRQLWQKIIGACAWPAGSIVFWPMSRLERGQIIGAIGPFLQGLDILCPQCIVCFGHRAFESLYPEQRFDYGLFESLAKVPLIALPGPQDMLPDNRRAKALVWSWLQEITARYLS